MPYLTHVNGLLGVPGFQAMGIACGIKTAREDLAILHSTKPARVAAVFTQNPFAAAPVHLSRQHAANGQATTLIVNSGNANACTGRQGLRDALAMVNATAEILGIPPEQILVASTGIIGRPMPMHKILSGIQTLSEVINDAQGGEFARAILTTDSGPKEANREIEGTPWSIGGVAKGAGMIHPNMATMLAFAVTDAPVPAPALREAWIHAIDRSFNMISVDGDESTNDMAAIFANGDGDELVPSHPAWPAFQEAIDSLCLELAKRIVSDGEGATRTFSVTITGATSDDDARKGARAVAASSLVKCAVHGGDPNWGRILAALGQSRITIEENVSLWLSGTPNVPLFVDGNAQAVAGLKLEGTEISFLMNIGNGPGKATAYGCDLTTDYVSFNADYKT